MAVRIVGMPVLVRMRFAVVIIYTPMFVAVVAINDMRGNEVMHQSRNGLDSYHTSQKASNDRICRGLRGQATLNEIIL